jgi:citrate lyase beta subunit
MRIHPCLFYTPALRVDSLLKSIPFTNGLLVLDLEDAIPTKLKAAARERLAGVDLTGSGQRAVGLRMNSIATAEGMRDIEMLIETEGMLGGLPVRTVFAPKIMGAGDVAIYRSLLSALPDPPEICSFIETVDAVENAFEIAACSDGLCFGQADLVSEMYAPNEAYLGYARARLCVAAAKFGLPAIDTNSFELWDMSIVRAASEAAKACGFTGKAAIHPRQVAAITETFAVDPAELDAYRRTIKDYEDDANGFAVTRDRVLAPPFVLKARRMLQLHDKTADSLG